MWILELESMLMYMKHRSDIHFWKTGRIGPLIVESDCILGHEAAGIVLKVGEGVDELVVGKFYTFFFSVFFFSSCCSVSLSHLSVFPLRMRGSVGRSTILVHERYSNAMRWKEKESRRMLKKRKERETREKQEGRNEEEIETGMTDEQNRR
jgi:hypothetical protein